MKSSISRRSFLTSALLIPWLSCFGRDARAEVEPPAALELGPAQPFSFDWLKEHARQLAAQPYQPPLIRYADVLDRIGYDVHRQIRYRPEAALWARGDGPYPVQFYHLARLFKEPVRLHVVRDEVAQEIRYSRKLFQYGDDAKFAESLPDDMGFAGFFVMNSMAQQRYWLSFLGASYFRGSGELDQEGISARGIAIDTGLPNPEEFPRFTSFWLEAGADPGAIMIYALLEGPSLTGAYRIEALHQGRVIMDMEAVLFFRSTIRRLGVAPLTSMFWFSETNHQPSWDWRPEVHDSDGLALWTRAGERIWRPLNNPPFVQVNSFVDNNPRGFGLSQRDRNFDNYQDDNVFYERRPTLWVEPLESWGEGVVQLVEIPTNYETNDNIVAYWVPQAPAQAGSTRTFRYRLHWVAEEPYWPDLGRVIATRMGWIDTPNVPPRPAHKTWFVIDFAGGPLEQLDKQAPVQVAASATRGKLRNSVASQVLGTRRWRAKFDVELEDAEPVDLRVYLRLGEQALTETWLYQLIPRPVSS